MNYIKHISIAALLALTACSDEGEWLRNNRTSDGVLNISFSLPAEQKIITRAEDAEDTFNEREINTLSILIYNSDGTKLLQHIPLTRYEIKTDDSSGDYKSTVSLLLNNDVKSETNDLMLIAVANADDLIDEENASTKNKLDIITNQSLYDKMQDGFVMSGTTSGSLEALSGSEISLIRTAAKVSIVKDETVTEKFKLSSTPIQIRKSAEAGYLTAGITSSKCAASDYISDFDSYLYVYPTEKDNAYVIIEGEYDGYKCYYRVDLIDSDDKHLDILPNYWYEIHITDVQNKGYGSADEAALHPNENITAEIHDHAPKVMSMVSDGKRELGVTRLIRYEGVEQASGSFCTDENYCLTVKRYSTNADEQDEPISFEIVEGNGWLEINETPVSTSSANIDYDNDIDNPGLLTTYALGFRATENTGELRGKIRVSWFGFSREVEVIWERTFDPTKICTAELIIHNTDNNNTYKINNYWNFLAGNGTGAEISGSPKLYGVDTSETGPSKVRDEGFHFPVMYGKNHNNPWWYEYNITLADGFKDRAFDYKIKFSGSSDAISGLVCSPTEGHHDANAQLPTINLKRDGAYGQYNNAVGEMTIELTYTVDGKTTTVPYPLDIYHTGFFHYDTYEHMVVKSGESQPVNAYYYYEVVKIGDKFWLDRNLGATSSGLTIIDENESPILNGTWPFNSGARGNYYKPAEYLAYADVEQKLYDNLCPPGYRIPSSNEWDKVRNSSMFNNKYTSNGDVTYYSSEILADNGDIVYFPKCRFIDNGIMMGEAQAGYYWTATAAKGTEKEEIGRWIKSLLFSGSSNSYVNGNVQDFGMSVRCIADIADNTQSYVTSFNIKGATHVYLYKPDGDKKIGMTTWPGKAVGDPVTMKEHMFNFVYESQYRPEEMKVIFNFVTTNGKIITIANNGNHKTLDTAEGFDIRPSGYYEFSVNEIDGTFNKIQ